MKVINDLLNYSNLKIVQDDEYFNFSLNGEEHKEFNLEEDTIIYHFSIY